jgi:glycyl-tRNA synthetase
MFCIPVNSLLRRLWGLSVRAKNFQEFALSLVDYWTQLGCLWSQPYDANMGAGTFHPHTFLKGIGPEPWRAVYLQPCRRPVDGRYGKSPYRFQHYYQLQVMLKPSPANIVDLFLTSLQHVGIDLKSNDVSLLEDDWKGPTLGAWGLGWEVRANGQEVTQFTYFQQLGGIDIEVVSGEITYGLERLYMYANGYDNALNIPYNDQFTYGDVFFQNEFEFSHFNFKDADTRELQRVFDTAEGEVTRLCERNLILPAYDFVLQASHAFNLLDARGAISVTERQRYIGRVRECARRCADKYRAEREKAGFPMLARLNTDARLELKKGGLSESGFPDVKEGKIHTKETAVAAKVCDFLMEVGVEEMPPSFQQHADTTLREKASEWKAQLAQDNKNDVEFAALLGQSIWDVFVTGRRLVLSVRGLPMREKFKSVSFWGPAERVAKNSEGGFSQAGLGFLKKNGLTEKDASFQGKEGGVFLFAEKQVPGRDLPTYLANEMRISVEALEAPLKMKWLPPQCSKPFVRPVRWILALADDRVIPIEMFGLKSGRLTAGLRILSPGSRKLERASEYLPYLKDAGVNLHWGERKSYILEKAQALAQQAKGRLVNDEPLLEKCAGLTESPAVFIGYFDEKYLSLPRPLIASVLKEHMNFFAVCDAGEGLLPAYVGVAGYHCVKPEEMVKGTQDVVVGRLEDGSFYYETDLATPIQELREKLKQQTFQVGMGSLFEKSERVSVLAEKLAQKLSSQEAPQNLAKNAGAFCKADLRSGCVQEFPDEMQGVMGGVLVRHQKVFGDESEVIAKAIEEHYEPKSATSPLPSSLLGWCVSLADKLDSLALMYAHGAELKGNKDPLGIRRLAIGVLRLLGMEVNTPVSQRTSFEEVLQLAREVLDASGHPLSSHNTDRLREFLLGRLKAAWRGVFMAHAVDAIAGAALSTPLGKARELIKVTEAALKRTGEGSLQEALRPYRRAKNLLSQPESMAVFDDASALGKLTNISMKLSISNVEQINEALFQAESEKSLLKALQNAETAADASLIKDDFESYFKHLAALALPLAQFFENVMVMDKDPQVKKNRLLLLARLVRLYEEVADFSAVQVS